MPRISGVDIPEAKRVDISLTSIFGVGRKNVVKILTSAKVNGAKRVKDLTEEEVSKIQKVVETTVKVEGDLRKEIAENIKRLKQIGSYRGKRHSLNLPVRGQRTRTNARTKRGKRMTIGALKKDDMLKKQKAEEGKTAPATPAAK
ncbi:30S ribosomal protein S13 [Candidatus Shapirobacteria bacterium CG09_land_8_20_14_0_10_39_12]|uniref:Small ribosomal subunit protein uS13 n=1 Tax=Candidatus Shapirobacteria bacterium CG09_land_8_20_14_0_10_39_12 TaxID=1974885 RepID=A0A2H0WP11_9BACT|nr:MAG: 30S ribosomal protein S13 [Candidatus Shapirobacteria bacterium CG09_land_8_20_14_0_10_39_12]